MNRKECYRNKELWYQTTQKQKKRYYASRNFGDGKRRRWVDWEIELLFSSPLSDTELAQKLHRSVAAIQIQRSRYRQYILRLWDELADIPFDEDENGELILAENWHCFSAGTPREEIWHWFDARTSGGVVTLLYS